MPLASTGVWTVLWSKVSRASSVRSDHIASASSPVLRMKLFRTSESVTPVWKLMPSAIWSTIWLPVILRLCIGPSNHMPALVCWM